MGRLDVELTPQHVQEKQFHDAFRGYNHEEVDRFLDEVAEAFAAAYKEREECRARIRELEGQLEQVRSTEEILKRTLLHANKAADETIRQARATSQKIVAESERKADELVTDAKRRTQGIVERAQSEVRELEHRVDGLRRFEHDYRAQLRAFIESQLRTLSGGAIHSQRRLATTVPQSRSNGEPPAPPELVELAGTEPQAGHQLSPDAEQALGELAGDGGQAQTGDLIDETDTREETTEEERPVTPQQESS